MRSAPQHLLYVSLLLGGLLHSTTTVAQYGSGHKISLPLAEKSSLPLLNRLFYIDSVYSNIPDTASVGVVYRPIAGDVVPTYLKGGLTQNIGSSLFSHYPQITLKHRPVRLRIDTFLYTEDPTQGYSFEADLTFFAKDTTGQYAPFYTANIDVETNGMSRGGRIADELIRVCTAMNKIGRAHV